MNNKKLNNEIINKRLKKLYNNEYILIGEYINNNTEILVKHNKCGNIYKVKPKKLLEFSYGLCPNCNSNETLYNISLETLKERINYIYNNSFNYIEGFKRNDKNCIISLKCNNCNSIINIPIIKIFRRPNKNICSCRENFGRGSYLIKDNYLQSLLDEKSYGTEYKWLEEYKGNNKLKHKIKHSCGNEYSVRPNDFQQGYKCPLCAHRNKSSSYEKELYTIIKKSYNGKIVQNIRMNNYEIDLFFPDLNIGIEFNGYYWHCDKHVKPNHDVKKLEFFLEKGINVYFINEIDYINKKELIIDKIFNILNINKNKNKIYARNCDIYENIPVSEQKDFLNKNHIQGYSVSKYSFGLYYYDILVGLMTFSYNRNNVNNKGKRLELVRYATDIKYIIPGGFSKLLSSAIYCFKNEYSLDTKYIYSYADRSLSRGKVYYTCGFELDKICKESYFYIDKNLNKKINRYSMRKSELKKLLPDYYDDNLTEFQIVDKSKRYLRCYNCGNYLFKKKI